MILAGYPDNQATTGETAGAPTLAGLRIAKENGWQPDPVPDEDSPARRSTAGNGGPK
jgi:NADH-quinone oxidoreductase subunit E